MSSRIFAGDSESVVNTLQTVKKFNIAAPARHGTRLAN
jgi:hypothetical protein